MTDFNELKQYLEENGTSKNEAPDPKKCENCGSDEVVVELEGNYLLCYDCGCEKQIISHENQYSSYTNPRNDVFASIKYNETKILNFKEYMSNFQCQHRESIDPDFLEKVRLKAIEWQQASEAAVSKQAQEISKAAVMNVLKSDFKDYRDSLHSIYYEITGDKPVDFTQDERDFLLDFKSILIFYDKTKDKRSIFSEKYVLYYLLKRKGYSVTLKDDFPEIDLQKRYVKSFSQM